MKRRDFLRGALAAGVAGTAGAPARSAESNEPPATQEASAIIPVRLRCETFRNPLGIDASPPRMSWQLQPADQDARGLRQLGYRIQVASSPEALLSVPDLWDSGFVELPDQLHVEFGGAPLGSRQRCFWHVRVWDTSGNRSDWSRPARWEMGLLDADDWQGVWIGDGSREPDDRAAHYTDDPAPLMRREFEIGAPVARARLYAAGLGYYELRLNGEKVSDHVLEPPWTSFDKRVCYATHDVTAMLQEGGNVVGAMLGNGWFNPLPLQMWGRINIREHMLTGRPQLIAQLEIEYEDGSREVIATDDSWAHHPGPIRRNSVYLGEDFDAREALPGWDAPGFDASAWSVAEPIADEAVAALGPLEAPTIPPIRITDRIQPVAVTEISPSVFMFDMGQNFAGWVRLQTEGPAGTRIRLRYGELLYPDGRLNPMTAVAGQIKRRNPDGTSAGGPGAPNVADQRDTFTLAGEGIETFTPRFTFHGFRYVEVSGLRSRPDENTIEGLRLNTDIDPTGEFSCSEETLNDIQSMTQWTLLSNLFSVQSDCPGREKFQYGGDIVATSEMASLNYDFESFYAKTVRDHADAVREDGWITETAPFVGISAESYAEDAGPIGWGLAHPLLAVQLHQYYGDRRIVAEQFETARRWVDLYADHADDHIIDRCISDHESIDRKPVELTATAHYYQAARLVARMAAILGRATEQATYTELADAIGAAFVDRFLIEGTGQFHIGTQAAQATALAMGLVPDEERERAVERMVDQVVEEHGGHIAAGIFGTKYLLEQLTRAGHGDVAYEMVRTREFPGWGYMLERGATTLWEHWEFSDNTYSHNHPMFGSVSEWFYKGIGGIRPHEEAVGFDRYYVEPTPVGNLTWAQTTVRGSRGRMDSNWYRESGNLHLIVNVPVNALAQIRIPAADPAQVLEGGRPAAEAPGVRPLSPAGGRARYLIGSGRYEFAVPE